MKTVLILAFSATFGVSSQQIIFPDMISCQKAAKEIEESLGLRRKPICIEVPNE